MLRKYAAHNSLLPFYLAWQLDPNNSNYSVSYAFSYQLENDEKINFLISKIQELIQLKAYLRQTFALENGKLITIIHDHLPAEIKFFTSATKDFTNLEQVLIKEQHNIETQSAIKLNIIHFNDSDQCVILFNIHHILMDGPGLDTFMLDLNRLIADEKIDQESADKYISRLVNESPLQEYKSHSGLADYIKEINDIANKINYPTGNKNIVWHYTDVLSGDVMMKLIVFSQQHHISTFNLLLLAWGIFVSKVFNQEYALINYPVNIRQDKSIPGCFVNGIIFPLTLHNDDTYLSLILSMQDKIGIFSKAARINLIEKLVINSAVSFSHSHLAHPVELIVRDKTYKAKSYPQFSHSALSVKYRERNDKYFFTCDILGGVFPEYFSSSLLIRFFNFLNKLLSVSSELLSNIDLTFTEEKKRLLYDFNNTDAFYPEDKTLVDLFEEQVCRTPDNIALVYEKITLTYAQLNEQANQLAHYLRNQYRIKPDDLIALLLDRNEYMLISILAVLKSGAAYVPLEPIFPYERIDYILEDTKTNIILTNNEHKLKFNVKDRQIITVDSQEIHFEWAKQIKTNPNKIAKSDNLAYVIYTSGTTGYPKGVMIEHKNVINFISSLPFSNSKHLNATFTAPYVFDVSIFDIWSNFLYGHTLYIVQLRVLQNEFLFKRFLALNKINKLYLPASLLKIHANCLSEVQSINQLLTGVEPLEYSFIKKIINIEKIINGYGPTETTVCSTLYNIYFEKNIENSIIPLGKPINNTKLYVLDRNLNVVPIGVVGELYIGGLGLARGYLNKPVLTNETFITNPFQTEKEKIAGKMKYLYRTGDLVCRFLDGNLEYIGRNDFQIKIRGYRVELSEIESKLTQYPGIEQAVVLVKKYLNDKYLAAYYTANKKLDEEKIQNYLGTQLPEYMLPSMIIYLDKLPLTINGKLDRESLPNINFSYLDNYTAPANQQEQLVCEGFVKILRLEKVGVNDSFFRMGGNSIKAITLVSYLQDNFNINVSDIYRLQTPKQIAKNISFERNNLIRHLEKIKLVYQIKNNDNSINQTLQNKLNKYMISVHNLPIDFQKKSLNNVLLTGATGFLGCNLLNEILASTRYRVYLLVRAKSHSEAFTRINKKFQFYFGRKLDAVNNQRLFVLAADIEKSDLALSVIEYQTLATQIDSIIHSAAMTKHYGEINEFYSANVQATINLLEFCKLTQLKDFHFISTASVFNVNNLMNYDQTIFTEDDLPKNIEGQSNFYIKTKCQGEEAVINYRQYSINSNIYRVGNLAFMASNYRAQENSEDSGFFNRIRCILNLEMIAKEMSTEEISPVDLTAQAIIKLFDKQELNNCINHVFNPSLYNLVDFFSQNNFFKVKVVPINQFIDTIIDRMRDPFQRALIDRFLVHQGWLNERDTQITFMRILQDRTHSILQQLGFTWMPINNGIFSQYLKMGIKNDKKCQSARVS